MADVSLIWAMDINRLIGTDDKLPWHYPKDLKFFKDMTKDQTVIMGDATYFSLKSYYKNKPLPFKKIYVASLKRFLIPDVIMINDIDEFMKNNKEDLFVIGGSIIYGKTLSYATKLYVTYILNQYHGNKYFPDFDISKYKLIKKDYEQELIFCEYSRI